MRQGDVAKSFVLVHGAWHGGWCWRRVADRLQAAGHKVWTPTLTGLGERSHLIGTHIDLSTHVTDIVNVLKWERLSDVALCGHSYGGFSSKPHESSMAGVARLRRTQPARRAWRSRQGRAGDTARPSRRGVGEDGGKSGPNAITRG